MGDKKILWGLAADLWPFSILVVASVAFGYWQSSWMAGLFLAMTLEFMSCIFKVTIKRVGDVSLMTFGRRGGRASCADTKVPGGLG